MCIHKMVTLLGILEGQTLTQVEENVAFDWSVIGYPSLFVPLYDWVSITY